MTGRLLRLGGTVLVVALGLVTPVLATSAPSPASADTVVDGCTIVSNPTPTNYTNCPNADLAGADLASLDLSYANLAGAQFVTCAYTIFPGATCTDANLASANLTQANLSGTTLSLVMITEASVVAGAADLSDATLTGADLSQASAFLNNMTGANAGGANLTDANLGGANLTNVDLTGATLTGTVFSGPEPPAGSLSAALTGATLTGTALVPSNQKVTQTSPTGAVVTWSTPPPIPGATPGTCTPPSGSTFPVGTTTVTCQVLDNANDVATGTFQVTVVPVTQVILPSNGATLSGTTYIAAAAPNATSVQFYILGGSYGFSGHLVGTATDTLYGWLFDWNTTTVPNGTYVLFSEAAGSGGSAFSSGVDITVNNPLPTTSVLSPSNGATLSGTRYIAAAAPNATSVQFYILGGSYGFSGHLVGTATDTLYGWLVDWDTTTVPNGTYVVLSEAANSGGNAFSSGVTITVANPGLADLANSSFTVTGSDVVGGNGCGFVYGAIDAVYPGSAAVGNVTLHVAGCVTPSTFTGSFTIMTGVGTLSGSAKGPIIEEEIGVDLVQIYEVTLSVNAATGSFAGTTGNLLFSTSGQGNVASVAVE